MDWNSNRGMTLAEILISLVIVGTILAASYYTYIYILKGFKQETESVSAYMESVIGLEILRLDVEHAGYGIASDETSLIMEVTDDANGNPVLSLRSTLNNTDRSTRGWMVAECDATNTLVVKVDSREDTNNNKVVVLTAFDKTYFDVGRVDNSLSIIETESLCASDDTYIAFPVEDELINDTDSDGYFEKDTANKCTIGVCSLVEYELGNTNLPERCNSGTFNLYRRVNDSTVTYPLLNCVADWEITFDLDTNGDGQIDLYDQLTPPSTNTLLRERVKRVNVYILYQEGALDRNYNYTGAVSCSSTSGMCVRVNGTVELELPTGYENYRWKSIKLSIKPINMR